MEEKVFFTSDGLKLCGILTKCSNNNSKCIILCHGITVDKEEDGIFTNLAKKLQNSDFNVFRFDFRGHGESEGDSIDLTVTGEERDLESAVNFLKNKGFKEFGILGASFGGYAVSAYSAKHEDIVKALILWNASIDYSSLLNPTTPWRIKYWGKPAFDRIEKFGFTEIGSSGFKVGKPLIHEVKNLEPWKELLKLDIPILFIHGDKDTLIDFEDSVKYSKLVKNGTLKIIHGAEHGFHESKKYSDLADKETINFLLKHLI